jgi:hypothetical protein
MQLKHAVSLNIIKLAPSSLLTNVISGIANKTCARLQCWNSKQMLERSAKFLRAVQSYPGETSGEMKLSVHFLT